MVLPFEIRGAHWGSEFADAVALELIKTGKFEIVERSALEQVLKEQRITKSGLFDPVTGAKIGRLLGASFIFVGSGKALETDPYTGRNQANLLDTFTLKVVHVESASNYVIVRKKPGIGWDWSFRAMWCLSLGLIWDRSDILRESSQYDRAAEALVDELRAPLISRLPALPLDILSGNKKKPAENDD